MTCSAVKNCSFLTVAHPINVIVSTPATIEPRIVFITQHPESSAWVPMLVDIYIHGVYAGAVGMPRFMTRYKAEQNTKQFLNTPSITSPGTP